ncbi:MAG: GGDEF domain-containing protein [Firmicutes bacterium]|nr:GGDEF domain-containing protein [Bacillota bacterium]
MADNKKKKNSAGDARENKTNVFMRRYKRNLIIIFTALIFLFDILLTTAVSYYATNTMNRKISMLMGANTYQQAMNVDSYFNNIKDTSSLFFSDEMYYTYDATQVTDDIEKIEKESVLVDRIRSLGVLENFSDFGIIYADNDYIGWLSEGMFEMLAHDEMYTFFSNHISAENAESGWFCTSMNNYDRIYYVKKINDHAVLVAAIFSRELESVFNVPQSLDGMDVRLTDENNIVLYSTNKDEIGKVLGDDIKRLVIRGVSASDKDYLVTSVPAATNGWNIICSLPEKYVTEDISRLVMFTQIFSTLLLIAVAIFGYLALFRVSNPISELVSSLADKAEHDQLTGAINKMSFRTMTETLMINGTPNDAVSFVMFDMDNFKRVNDNLGHITGDDVLVRFAKLLNSRSDADSIFGRIGGDEFAMLTIKKDTSPEKLREMMEPRLEELRMSFLNEFEVFNKSCGLSLSIGAVMANDDNMDFESAYKLADDALYTSKNEGKNRVTIVVKKGSDVQ